MSSIFDDNYRAKDFIRSMTETIAWCSTRADTNDPENSLRNLKRRYGALEPRDTYVSGVALERSRELSRLEANNFEPVTDLRGGRLLAFDPSGNLSDGAACGASDGYFDNDNTPPIDTWIYYIYEETYARRIATEPWSRWIPFETYLLSWVPPKFLKLANAGIENNPEGCIGWFDELDLPLLHAMRKRKFLV